MLLHQSGPKARGPIDTTLGGYPATRIDLAVPEGFDLKPCNVKDVGLQIWYSVPADKYFVLLPGGIMSVYIVDVDGQRQIFVTPPARDVGRGRAGIAGGPRLDPHRAVDLRRRVLV